MSVLPTSFSFQKKFKFAGKKYCEMAHDKTNKTICGPSEDSDQPRHLPNLIRVFAVRSKDSQGPKVSSCGQRRLLIRLGGCPG